MQLATKSAKLFQICQNYKQGERILMPRLDG